MTGIEYVGRTSWKVRVLDVSLEGQESIRRIWGYVGANTVGWDGLAGRWGGRGFGRLSGGSGGDRLGGWGGGWEGARSGVWGRGAQWLFEERVAPI